jgi:hypothetical protein
MFAVCLNLNDYGLPSSDPLTIHGAGTYIRGTTSIRYVFHDPAANFPGSDCPVDGVLLADRYIPWAYRSNPAGYDWGDEPAVSISLGDPNARDKNDWSIEVGDWAFSGYVICSGQHLEPGPHPEHADRDPFKTEQPLDAPTYCLASGLLRAIAADYVHRWKTRGQ